MSSMYTASNFKNAQECHSVLLRCPIKWSTDFPFLYNFCIIQIQLYKSDGIKESREESKL